MKLYIGSTNPSKVEALIETIRDYSFLANAEVYAYKTASEVSHQPLTLEETVQGAMQRAKNVFGNCDYSFGIESGLFEFPLTKSYMDVCVCIIYDGNKFFEGLSCGFTIPPKINRLVHKSEVDMEQACFETNLTSQRKIGSAEGIIGLLTKGRITRKDYTKQAIQMALIQLENPELYK